MKKKHLFLLLTVLWVVNAGIGGVSLYMDVANPVPVPEAKMLSHGLYMIAALVAAGLTFYQYWRHRTDA